MFILNKHPCPCGRYGVCVYTGAAYRKYNKNKKTRAVSGSLSWVNQVGVKKCDLLIHFSIFQCSPSVNVSYASGSADLNYGPGFIDSGSSISGWIPIRIRFQGSNDQKLENIYSWKKDKIFFDQKLQFTNPYASIKDVQATGEAFSPQKRTSSTSKHEISKLFFVGHFCGPGCGSRSTELIESGS